MNGEWKPSALRAAGDIDRQAASDIDLGTMISTRDGMQLVAEWRDAIARAERAEAALRTALDSKEFFRVCWEKAEAELAAVPWQALLNISHALAASDAANDPDEAALLSFLNRYAPWVPPSDNDLLSDGLEEK